MKGSPTHFFSLLFVIMFAGTPFTHAQSLISKYELKKCEYQAKIYPYEWFDISRGFYGPVFQPSLRLSETEFVYITQPQRRYSERTITCFNLLLEPIWETEIKLNHGEEIFHLFRSPDKIVVMSGAYDYPGQSHNLWARTFDIKSGKELDTKLLYTVAESKSVPIGFDFSPDGSSFTIFHFEQFSPKRKIKEYYDYLLGEEELGFRISNVGKLRFAMYDLEGSLKDQGYVDLNFEMKSGKFVVDCQLGNDNQLYISTFQFPSTLAIIQYNPQNKERKELQFNNYPNPWEKQEPYLAMIPPTIGKTGKVFASFSMREKIKGTWRTLGFQMIAFDFQNMKIDNKRKVDINSSFLVEVAKSREAAGMKPQTIFDRHLMKEIIEMPDGSIWLLTQKYDRGSVGYTLAVPEGNGGRYASKLEEIILYEFSPEGKITKALVVPMIQRAATAKEMAGRFYSLKTDLAENKIHLITREYSGDKHRSPPRIYYRAIDLQEGFISDRKLIFEGKGREQYLINAYTVWLNPKVAVMMVLDGDFEKRPDIVSVRVTEN